MCAGISFPLSLVDDNELHRFLTTKEIAGRADDGYLEIFFWDARPFLPVLEEGKVHLYDWGNREKDLKLPKTGWAMQESLRDGRWDWLSPKLVLIPAFMGSEKKKWFLTPEGIKAIKVRYHNITRVYMITSKASQEYLRFTGHDRMPMAKIVY